jgi:hypothetical protein
MPCSLDLSPYDLVAAADAEASAGVLPILPATAPHRIAGSQAFLSTRPTSPPSF